MISRPKSCCCRTQHDLGVQTKARNRSWFEKHSPYLLSLQGFGVWNGLHDHPVKIILSARILKTGTNQTAILSVPEKLTRSIEIATFQHVHAPMTLRSPETSDPVQHMDSGENAKSRHEKYERIMNDLLDCNAWRFWTKENDTVDILETLNSMFDNLHDASDHLAQGLITEASEALEPVKQKQPNSLSSVLSSSNLISHKNLFGSHNSKFYSTMEGEPVKSPINPVNIDKTPSPTGIQRRSTGRRLETPTVTKIQKQYSRSRPPPKPSSPGFPAHTKKLTKSRSFDFFDTKARDCRNGKTRISAGTTNMLKTESIRTPPSTSSRGQHGESVQNNTLPDIRQDSKVQGPGSFHLNDDLLSMDSSESIGVYEIGILLEIMLTENDGNELLNLPTILCPPQSGSRSFRGGLLLSLQSAGRLLKSWAISQEGLENYTILAPGLLIGTFRVCQLPPAIKFYHHTPSFFLSSVARLSYHGYSGCHMEYEVTISDGPIPSNNSMGPILNHEIAHKLDLEVTGIGNFTGVYHQGIHETSTWLGYASFPGDMAKTTKTKITAVQDARDVRHELKIRFIMVCPTLGNEFPLVTIRPAGAILDERFHIIYPMGLCVNTHFPGNSDMSTWSIMHTDETDERCLSLKRSFVRDVNVLPLISVTYCPLSGLPSLRSDTNALGPYKGELDPAGQYHLYRAAGIPCVNSVRYLLYHTHGGTEFFCQLDCVLPVGLKHGLRIRPQGWVTIATIVDDLEIRRLSKIPEPKDGRVDDHDTLLETLGEYLVVFGRSRQVALHEQMHVRFHFQINPTLERDSFGGLETLLPRVIDRVVYRGSVMTEFDHCCISTMNLTSPVRSFYISANGPGLRIWDFPQVCDLALRYEPSKTSSMRGHSPPAREKLHKHQQDLSEIVVENFCVNALKENIGPKEGTEALPQKERELQEDCIDLSCIDGAADEDPYGRSKVGKHVAKSAKWYLLKWIIFCLLWAAISIPLTMYFHDGNGMVQWDLVPIGSHGIDKTAEEGDTKIEVVSDTSAFVEKPKKRRILDTFDHALGWREPS